MHGDRADAVTRRAPYPFPPAPPAPPPVPAMVRWGCRWGAVMALAVPLGAALNAGTGRPLETGALSAALVSGVITAPPYRHRRR